MSNLLDRPKALTDEVQGKILDAMSLGMRLRPACDYAGITSTAVEYWRKLVEDGVEHAQVYADFFDKMKKAVAVCELAALRAIQLGEQGWQSRAWLLERRFAEDWRLKSDAIPVNQPKPEQPKRIIIPGSDDRSAQRNNG